MPNKNESATVTKIQKILDLNGALDEKEYKEFNEKLNAAKAFVSADSIERDLILLSATAVEDELQQGVCLFVDKPFCSASYFYAF